MKFLCLGYYDEKKFDALAPDEIAALGRAVQPYDEALRATGKMLDVVSLAPAKEAKSLRPRNGRTVVTDGPFAETKEQLGSFFIIEAEDLDEAVTIASMHPAAQLFEEYGLGVEVRAYDTCRATAATRATA